jgi:HlyD family secretion protein
MQAALSWRLVKRLALLIVIVAVAAAAYWIIQKRSEPPQVPFVKATRTALSSVVATNGKVEPIDYVEVRVETPGLVNRVLVRNGGAVAKDQVLAELSTPGLADEIAAASAREAQARAELSTLQAGGSSAAVAELDGNLRRLRSDREAAQKNAESLDRLTQKQAATPYEASQAHQAVQSLDVQIQSLESRRKSLVGKGDLAAAEARLSEAEANLQLTKGRQARSLIHAPIGGTIYDLPARVGSFLNAGDIVARLGKLDPVRVRVYVDEPELGRVALGQKVRITWDGLSGREWNGVVASRPSQIIALGSRQVGEVLCTIDNPGRELAPGTNVNAFILTQVVDNALTIPKAAVRRDSGLGVFVLQPDRTVKWQPITTGISDALRVEIKSGLNNGDAVVQSTDQALKTGDLVAPVYQ